MKVTQDSGYYNYWNNINTKSDKKEKEKKQAQVSTSSTSKNKKKKKKPGINVKKAISSSRYLLRLANAKSVPKVNGVIRAARADMVFVRSSGSSNQQVERAMRILKRVVAKGNIKAGKLKKEKQLKIQKEIAKKLHKEKKARELQMKLRSKKNCRKRKERADAATDLETVTIESNPQQDSYEERIAAYEALTETTNSSIDVVVSDATPVAEAVDTGGIDITV